MGQWIIMGLFYILGRFAIQLLSSFVGNLSRILYMYFFLGNVLDCGILTVMSSWEWDSGVLVSCSKFWVWPLNLLSLWWNTREYNWWKKFSDRFHHVKMLSLWTFVSVNSKEDFVESNIASLCVVIYCCCRYYSYNGESKTSKTKSFSLSQPIAPAETQVHQDGK